MTGMDAATGAAISGDAHLEQSIRDILSTPIGSRVGRRDYGSLLAELIDAPLNRATTALMRAATAIALAAWEPRLRLTAVQVTPTDAGTCDVALTGVRTDTAAPNSLSRLTLPLRPGAPQ